MEQTELQVELAHHHADGFGWALACCGWDRLEAEEVQQEAVLRILDGRARFEGRASFRTWLFAVIRRTAAERRRRAAVRARALLRWWERRSDPPSRDPEEEVQLSRASRELIAVLSELPERQRQVLHLVFYQDLKIREAAEVLGVSVGTARTHYERGKRRLRALLGKDGDE